MFIRKDRHAGRQRLELDEAKDNDRPTTSFTNRRLNDQQPTRTLFVRGIGWVNTNGSADEVRRLFKGIAEIENVRMCTFRWIPSSYVWLTSTKLGIIVMSMRVPLKRPFT